MVLGAGSFRRLTITRSRVVAEPDVEVADVAEPRFTFRVIVYESAKIPVFYRPKF